MWHVLQFCKHQMLLIYVKLQMVFENQGSIGDKLFVFARSVYTRIWFFTFGSPLPHLGGSHPSGTGAMNGVVCYEASDLLSQFPDDLLFFIMSSLTMKSVAKMSVLSRRWNYLWRHIPVLVFEDSSAMKRMRNNDKAVLQERLSFMKWADRVVQAHLGQYVDELRVTFDLNKRFHSYLDKWLKFAFEKQVKRLELDFSSSMPGTYGRSVPNWHMSPYVSILCSCLRSLSLIYVDLTSKDVECLLRSCAVLEKLCIGFSPFLKCIRASDLPLPLKHLEVSFCRRLETIDILAPKLVSFAHYGEPIELHIRNASLLSKLSLGYLVHFGDVVSYAFDSLSNYFPQLEYLFWEMQLPEEQAPRFADSVQFNLGIKNPPAMTNLKHLELYVYAMCNQSLLGWADLIEASPLLERLTLKILDFSGTPNREITKRNGSPPLKSLKTLELRNDLGLPIDLEFASYVIENSVMLKDVIVELRPFGGPLSERISLEEQVASIKRLIPQGVRLTLTMVDTSNIRPPWW